MAGLKPFFLTGANAKIRINGVTLAFATNLSYSITVNHATPTVLGMYEPSSIEPISYAVSGSFTVIRYVADITSDVKGDVPNGTSRRGNGIGTFGKEGLSARIAGGLDISKPDGRAYDSFNPSALSKASMFDIEIYQKIPGENQRAVAKIRDARISKSDFSLNSKSAATQNFSFIALYADEDSFLADFSGQGQQFS